MSTTHFSKKFRRLSIRRDYANCARFQQLRFRSEMARRRPMQQAMLGAASGGLTRDASCTRPAANGLLLGVLEGYAYFRFACQGLPLPLRVPLTGPVIQARLADESYNARPWASTFEHGGADSGFRVHHDAVGREGGHWGSARTSYKQSYAITVAVSNVRLAVKWLDVHRGRWYGYIARMESKVERSNQAGNPTLGKLR